MSDKKWYATVKGVEGRDLSTLSNEEMLEWQESLKSKTFQELSGDDRNFLTQQAWNRAVKEGRELLWDVRCVYTPEMRAKYIK